MILFASFSVTSFSQAMLLVIRWATAHRAHHSLAWMQQLKYGCTYIFLSQWATVRIFIIKNELPASPTFLSKLHCCYATVYATCQICQHDGVFQLNAGSCAHPNERLARAEPSLLKTLLGSDLHRTGIWMSRNLAAWQWFASRTEYRVATWLITDISAWECRFDACQSSLVIHGRLGLWAPRCGCDIQCFRIARAAPGWNVKRPFSILCLDG